MDIKQSYATLSKEEKNAFEQIRMSRHTQTLKTTF